MAEAQLCDTTKSMLNLARLRLIILSSALSAHSSRIRSLEPPLATRDPKRPPRNVGQTDSFSRKSLANVIADVVTELLDVERRKPRSPPPLPNTLCEARRRRQVSRFRLWLALCIHTSRWHERPNRVCAPSFPRPYGWPEAFLEIRLSWARAQHIAQPLA